MKAPVSMADRRHASALPAAAVAALALGAVAIGFYAIGRLAIGQLVIGRARFRRVEIDDLTVGRLHIRSAAGRRKSDDAAEPSVGGQHAGENPGRRSR
jgi:hypothetical protein